MKLTIGDLKIGDKFKHVSPANRHPGIIWIVDGDVKPNSTYGYSERWCKKEGGRYRISKNCRSEIAIVGEQPPVTHDTFIIGGKKGKITFIKSYVYLKQKDEAQMDLEHVQDEKKFDMWYISHVGSWTLSHNVDSECSDLKIDVPIPTN